MEKSKSNSGMVNVLNISDKINRIYMILWAEILTQRTRRRREERKGFVSPLRQNLCELCVERAENASRSILSILSILSKKEKVVLQ